MKEKLKIKDSKLVEKITTHPKVGTAKGFANEFMEFLREYSILGIAMGLVIGGAVTTLVQSIVNGLITPLIQLIVPAGLLKDLVYTVGTVEFKIGPVIDALLNFIIVALLFFIFVKVIFKKDKVSKI